MDQTSLGVPKYTTAWRCQMGLKSILSLSHGWCLGEDDWNREENIGCADVRIVKIVNPSHMMSSFMAEVSTIENARPLVPIITDPENPRILSPVMLITQKMTGIDHLDNIDDKD